VLAGVVVAAGVLVAVVAYQRLGTAEVTGTLAGYRVIDDETVSVTINVTRSDPSRPVACIVRVRSKDGSETGRRELLIPPAQATTVQITTMVKSHLPPVLGDIYGCGTDVPGYLRPS
jgi:phage tail tape-measure protein